MDISLHLWIVSCLYLLSLWGSQGGSIHLTKLWKTSRLQFRGRNKVGQSIQTLTDHAWTQGVVDIGSIRGQLLSKEFNIDFVTLSMSYSWDLISIIGSLNSRYFCAGRDHPRRSLYQFHCKHQDWVWFRFKGWLFVVPWVSKESEGTLLVLSPPSASVLLFMGSCFTGEMSFRHVKWAIYLF